MFCKPSTFDVSFGFASGNIDSLGSTKHTVSLGLVLLTVHARSQSISVNCFMLQNKQSHRHSLCSMMSRIMLLACMENNVEYLARNAVTKILLKKLYCDFRKYWTKFHVIGTLKTTEVIFALYNLVSLLITFEGIPSVLSVQRSL